MKDHTKPPNVSVMCDDRRLDRRDCDDHRDCARDVGH
jgi:hypothetical protein